MVLLGLAFPQACAHALFTLAANPQYMAPLREEIEAVIRKHGWSKAAMSEMLKLDSVLKEALRVYAFNACQQFSPLPPVTISISC